MEDYRLEQSGQDVQDILNGAAMQSNLTAETERAEREEQALQGAIDDEALARQNADGVLQGKIDDEEARAKAAEKQNADDIDAIEEKIPSGASAENKLATEGYVNDSVATASATFRGTYNLVTDLHMSTSATRAGIAAALGTAISGADNNDYAFVMIPTSEETPTEIARVERYKFNGTAWGFEYTLNNSGYTSAQWAAINSGITSGLVQKLGPLPSADDLAAALLAKQDKLTFDSAPTPESTNPVTSGGVYTAVDNEKGARQNADQQLQQAIEAILALIPSAATALNQLADKAFVNSSIATDTSTFRGTYNLVTDLHLAVNASHSDIATALLTAASSADNNDYCFVQVPTSVDTPTEIRVTERYKFDGTAWQYEYDLNNSGFTAQQWEAINSAITSALVSKLSALPTASELATELAGKQAVLTFDNQPTSGSSNPVKSGGVYDVVAAINAKIPSDADAANKMTTEARIATIIGALDATFDLTSADGHITFKMTQTDGLIASVQILTYDIASAAALTTLGGRVSLNESDISNLQAAYAALTQSDIVIVNGALPSSGQQQNIIYRQPDLDHTPPQFYSDYMWNGSNWVLMAQYNNAIDDEPTVGSHNLVESGGVANGFVSINADVLDNIEAQENTVLLINGLTIPFADYKVSSFIKIDDIFKLGFISWLYADTGSTIAGICFYADASDSSFIGYYNGTPVGFFELCIADVLSDYPNAKFIRLGTKMNTTLSLSSSINRRLYDIEDDETRIFVSEPFLVNDYFLTGYGRLEYNTNLCVSPYLKAELVVNKTFNNLRSITVADCYPIAFYDKEKRCIGVYSDGNANDHLVTLLITDSLLANYPNTKYIRITTSRANVGDDVHFSISDTLYTQVQQLAKTKYLEGEKSAAYRFNMFYNALFCGDSVTEGFVVEGTESNPETINRVMPDYAYPVQFGKMFTNLEVAIKARSGISATQWKNDFYPNVDFSDYDLIVFELGLNGYLTIDDINTAGTNTNDYRLIIQGVRQQNPNAVICLVRSSHFTDGWMPVLNFIANESNCIVVDLYNTDYLNLDDSLYHGYYDNGGVAAIDYAHFTRKGYNAKAFVVSRLIAQSLTDVTQY